MSKRQNSRPRVVDLASSAAILALIAALLPLTLGQFVGVEKDFYDNIWEPANLLLHGRDAYAPSSLTKGLPAIWAPVGLSLFSPLGFLDPHTSSQVWFAASVAELLLVVFLVQASPKWPVTAAVGGLATCLFPAAIQHFVLGQFSITAMLCLILAARSVQGAKDWQAAFFAALALTKPQLGFLALFGLAYACFRRSGWRRALLFGLRVIAAVLTLTLPLIVVSPSSIPSWVTNLRDNPAWLHPSILSVLVRAAGGWGFVIWGGTALAGLVACWHLWGHFEPEIAMVWTLALTVIIVPHVWSWDFVLLMPLWVSAFDRVNSRKKALLILTYLMSWMGMAIAQVQAGANNQAFWWVPMGFAGVIAAVSWCEFKAGGEQENPSERAAPAL